VAYPLGLFSAGADWQRIQYFSSVAVADADPWSKSADSRGLKISGSTPLWATGWKRWLVFRSSHECNCGRNENVSKRSVDNARLPTSAHSATDWHRYWLR